MSRLGRHAAVLAASACDFYHRKSSETTCCNDADESSATFLPRASREARDHEVRRGDDNSERHRPLSILASSSVRSAGPIEVVCDYAVIGGSGKSGSSAVETIRSFDPKARIVVVDPLVSGASMNRMNRGVRHIATRATSIDHSNKTVCTGSTRAHHGTARIKYMKSALIATGSRPAPPPESCIRPDSWSRILELNSTAVPSEPTDTGGPIKPMLDPRSVRTMAIMAASQGAKVAIMGSGFDALEVAATCALNASEASSSIQKEDSKVALVFGNAGVLSNRLPRYLSSAVTKRLRQSGVAVHDRSMTRYISMDRPADLMPRRDPARLELYTVKTYDHLDSLRITADLLVYAPCMDTSLNGTAVIPSGRSDPLNPSLDIYLPWSNLVMPPLVTCYLDDGRIATNAELNAASSIYAAGSVAKFPCSQTGKAEIAGGRHISAEESGRIAALNMIKTNCKSRSRHEEMKSESISNHMPVWRTDRISYMPNEEKRSESLYAMGIHALAVGRCDSDECATHGFWWTNSKDQRSTGIVDSPPMFMKRATKRVFRKARQSGRLPAYGSGVIFYLDETGNITGVMIWGLPFSSDASDVSSSVNEELVERMRSIIRSNGAIAIGDHSAKVSLENEASNIDLSLLSYLHLAEESKHLASIALSGPSDRMDKESTAAHIVGRRPLHRYCPAKLAQLTSLGKLFRSGDVFYPVETVHDSSRCREESRPPSLKRIYPMSHTSGSEEENFEREMEMRQLQLDRSRPPKEDQLWLRRGDENRFVNAQDARANEFIKNMVNGRFADGSDAVSQAPTPEIYLDAMGKISEVNSALRHMVGIETEECSSDEDGPEDT